MITKEEVILIAKKSVTIKNLLSNDSKEAIKANLEVTTSNTSAAIEKATPTEVIAGTNNSKYVTPLGFNAAVAGFSGGDQNAAVAKGLLLNPPDLSILLDSILNFPVVSINNNFPTQQVFANTDSTSIAGYAGVIKRFFIYLTGTLAGREVTWYVISYVGLNVTCLHRTTPQVITTPGINYYTPPSSVAIPVGAVIAARVTGSDSTKLMGFHDSGGASITTGISFNTDLALNGVYTFDQNEPTRKFGLGAEVYYSSLIALVNNNWRNKESGFVGLDTIKQFSNTIGRIADMYWSSKKIIWTGTSIPTSGTTPYPGLVGSKLNANVVNEAVGSSGIIWNGVRPLSLSATIAELTAAFPGNEGQSYENKIIGKAADLVVFDHGFNDRAAVNLSADITSMDKSTFYGSFNFIINKMYIDNPSCRFCFITPPTRHDYAPQSFTIAQVDDVCEALKRLALRYNAPFFDMAKMATINNFNKASWTSDSLHPNDTTNAKLAHLVYSFIKDIS